VNSGNNTTHEPRSQSGCEICIDIGNLHVCASDDYIFKVFFCEVLYRITDIRNFYS
jgi:hypothetical protein